MATRIPPLLSPYLTIPSESSLLLLTGVLGASTNWLVLRYVYSLLQDTQPPVNILLVSFLRDITFWKDAASRIGLDLMAHGRAGRFIFGEGLTGGLFTDTTTTEPTGWMISMNTAVLGNVKTMLEESIEKLKTGGSRVVLIIDQIDLLLAAGGESISVKEVREMLLDLRETSHACIMTLSADDPLVTSQVTTLEKEHAALLLGIAHDSEMVLSLRLLDTGTAKDVSGVIRITRGGAESERKIDEHEYLYHIGGDIGVRVFERGQ